MIGKLVNWETGESVDWETGKSVSREPNLPVYRSTDLPIYHFVGIGGIGLSAIAKVLLEEGFQVSGSDLRLSPITDALADLGAAIYQGHRAANVDQADLVVVSSAIPVDNAEVTAAREKGIRVVKRDWVLGHMMEDRFVIAVAGSHGKTTIAAMIALLLTEAGLDPTFIVGGVLQNLGTNARAGRGEHFVVEADEYDRTFLGLRPRMAVVTNIEMDHPDCYPDLDDLLEAFREFVELVPADGCVIGCGDEERVREVLAREQGSKGAREQGSKGAEERGPDIVTYGLNGGVDWQAIDIRSNELGGNDFVALHDGCMVGEFALRIPGLQNVQNALAVLAVAHELGLDLTGVGETLRGYRGVQRRFEVKGQVNGVVVIDDYAHHPTQIRATLRAARERYAGRTIWTVFQPHTYSRTKALLSEFASSFADADHVIVTAIYAAREFDDLGVNAADIVARMSHPDAHYICGLNEAAQHLRNHLKPGDVLITLGAGDGYKVGEMLLAEGVSEERSKGELVWW
jgi:UDP-N-acetylmuramate--alanine ligase